MRKALVFIVKISFVISLLLIFVGQHINESRTISENEIPQDTTIAICKGSVFEVPVELVSTNLNNFIAFSQEYCDKALKYNHRQLVDTTGDGKLELVHTAVVMNEHTVHIKNTIVNDEGEYLWNNEIKLDTNDLASMWNEEFNYEAGLPISAFYAAVSHSKFVGFLNKANSNYDERKKCLLRFVDGPAFMAKDLEKIYNSDLSNELDQYEGRFILDLNQGYRLIYKWDEKKNKFVPLSIS